MPSKTDSNIQTLREEYYKLFRINNIIRGLYIRHKLSIISLITTLILTLSTSAYFYITSDISIISLISYCFFSGSILLSIKLLDIAIRSNKKESFNDSELTDQEYYIRQLSIIKKINDSDIFKAQNVMKIKNNYKSSTKRKSRNGIYSAINNFLIPICLTIFFKHQTFSDIKIITYVCFLCITIPTIITMSDGVLYNKKAFIDNKIIYFIDIYKAEKK